MDAPPRLPREPFTSGLARLADGDRGALDELLPLIYDELRRLARQQRRHGPADFTLDTTALVHEAFLRLVRPAAPAFCSRGHFLAVAATAMRQLLVDEAKHHTRNKRGGGVAPVRLDGGGIEIAAVAREADLLLALDQALGRLEQLGPRLRQVVECRYFAGLSEEETATALGVTARTVRRDWIKARGLLRVLLGADASATGG